MDVSIRPADKQTREAFITARDKKQATQDQRTEKRRARKTKKRTTVTMRRLRRRIEKEVRTDLRTEKKSYLRGEPTGSEYVIDTLIRYGLSFWLHDRSVVEGVLEKVLAQHTGFEYKVDFKTDYGAGDPCRSIRITYTLLNH